MAIASTPRIQELLDAVQSGDTNRVRALLAEKPELVAMDTSHNDERRALHLAVLRRHEPLVRLLMEAGADPTKGVYPHRDATSALALAQDREYSEIVAALELTKPVVQPPAREQQAPEPIREAIERGDVTGVRQMIEAHPGLLSKIGRDGGLLTEAVKQGSVEIAKLLLDLGADVDERIFLQELEAPTLSWGYPLWHAARDGNLTLTRLLLDRGADPNGNVYASGWPLRNAWDLEDDSIKRLLLERGARLQPYMVAENHDIAEATRMLAADPGEDLARELAISAADYGCLQILQLALRRLNWSPSDPRWHWVIIQPIRGASSGDTGQYECMKALLGHGVDPNVSRFGQTALHYAAARHGGLSGEDRARFAAMLLDAGAQLDVRDDLLRSTPLGWACRWGRVPLAKLFIARGASVEEPDAEPWATPKAWATKKHHADLLELLLREMSPPKRSKLD